MFAYHFLLYIFLHQCTFLFVSLSFSSVSFPPFSLSLSLSLRFVFFLFLFVSVLISGISFLRLSLSVLLSVFMLAFVYFFVPLSLSLSCLCRIFCWSQSFFAMFLLSCVVFVYGLVVCGCVFFFSFCFFGFSCFGCFSLFPFHVAFVVSRTCNMWTSWHFEC